MLKRKSEIQLEENEKIILYIPKNCGCDACNIAKQGLIEQVGLKRFKKISRMVNLTF